MNTVHSVRVTVSLLFTQLRAYHNFLSTQSPCTGIQGNHGNPEALDFIGRATGLREKGDGSQVKRGTEKKKQNLSNCQNLCWALGRFDSESVDELTMSWDRHYFNGSLPWCSSQNPYPRFKISDPSLVYPSLFPSVSLSLSMSGLGGESPILLTLTEGDWGQVSEGWIVMCLCDFVCRVAEKICSICSRFVSVLDRETEWWCVINCPG